MNEVERISDPMSGPAPIGNRWRRLPLGSLGGIWWASFVAGIVLWWVATGMGVSAEDFWIDSIFGTALYVYAAAALLLAISGALAASYVMMIRRRLNRERGPVPLHPVAGSDNGEKRSFQGSKKKQQQRRRRRN